MSLKDHESFSDSLTLICDKCEQACAKIIMPATFTTTQGYQVTVSMIYGEKSPDLCPTCFHALLEVMAQVSTPK